MTSLSLTKPRTTARRKRAAGTACNLACVAAALAALAVPAAAQPPGPAAVPSAQAAPPLAIPLPPGDAVAQQVEPKSPDPKKVPDLGGNPQPKTVDPKKGPELGGDPQPPQPKGGADVNLTLDQQAARDRQKYTALPKPEDVLHIYNNAQLEQIIMNSIREPALKKGIKIEEDSLRFPPMDPVGGNAPYVAKTGSYPPMQTAYDALYVVHRRLHFEEKNAERYGWDLGIVQPVVSALYFYRDVMLWPQSLASGFAYGFWDTSAGKCLPGTPVPYYLYPPGLTITGCAYEGVIMTGLAFIFP